MRQTSDYLVASLPRSVFLFAAALMTVAFPLQAQNAKTENPQPSENESSASDVSAYQEQLSKESQTILGLLAEASALMESEDYPAAQQKIDEANLKIQNFQGGKPSVLRESLKEKCDFFQKKCCTTQAEAILAKSRNEYITIISEKDLASIADKSEKEKKELLRAKYLYYLGVNGGDQAALKKAILMNPEADFAQRVDALIKDYSEITNYYDVSKEASMDAIDPAYKDRKKEIQVLYHEGENLYRKRRFTQARDKMEQILILDPYNDKAMQMLTRIYRKLYFIADMRAYNELLQDQALVEWRWMENIPREQSVLPEQTAREYTDTNSPLYEKSKHLIIPSISFDNHGVADAVDYLREKSKEIDPERIGVHIMIQGLSKNDDSELAKKVTFTLQNVPLFDAIRYLCLQTGLKFRINEKNQIIVIGPPSEIAKGDTKTKVYIPIRRATVNRMINYRAEIEGDTKSSSSSDSTSLSVKDGMGISVEDTFTSGVAAALAKRRAAPDYSEKLRAYFISLGFDFPDDTFIAYDSRKNRIVVQNTPETLRKLELLIREIDIDTPLVLMESKIMEISLDDMEELGFDWTLTHENTNPRWSFAISSPLREAAGTDNVLINNMNILPNFGGDNIWNLYLTVNAIDRTSRSEVLSTPRLMAKNGESASIRMVRMMYFPESWSEPEISTSCGSSVTLEPSIPEFGDATDIGVIFNATPVVSPNNYTINLDLAPAVVDLVGWSDYSYEIVFGNFGTDPSTGSSANGDNTTKITMKMPELSVRSVETKVKVYDGQTVVIGGMLWDRQTRRDDRWPILGDVPLLGRLFTNDSTFIEKDNLLISVTSRLISGDGVPLRSNPANGLPDFRR